MYSLKSFVANPLLILGLLALALPVCAQDVAQTGVTPPVAAPVAAAPTTTAQAQLLQPLPQFGDDEDLFDMDLHALDGPPLDAPQETQDAAATRKQPSRDSRRMSVEMRLRAMMSDFGLEDHTRQDALIAYLAEDEAGKARVREASRRLLTSVKRNTPPDRMRDVIAVYKNAIATDKERRTSAQISLDAKIGFSLDPHLEGVLYLFGVLGDGQANLPAPTLAVRVPGPTARNPMPSRGEPNRGANPFLGDTQPRGNNGYGNNGYYGGGNRGNNFNPGDELRPAAPRQLGPLQRAGVVYGTVVGTGDIWIDIKTQTGNQERYMPFWTTAGEGGGYNRAVIDAIAAAKKGDLVRLEWVLNERRRVVKIDSWQPDAATGITDKDIVVPDTPGDARGGTQNATPPGAPDGAAPATTPGENPQP